MQIALRPALAQDFEYCKRVYFHEMERIIQELHLDRAAQLASFARYWTPAEVRIITLDALDVGWLQSSVEDDGLFLAQLFVEGPFQGRGIGTEVMNRLIADAARANQAVVLAVVKINPALRLYERLAFHITDEDDRKYYLKRDPVPPR
jgi:GNAT superfamily N-acetyltransferase